MGGASPRSNGPVSFAWRPCLDGEGVDPLLEELGKRRIDRALPLKAVHARKLGRLDLDCEVAFAARVMAGMAAMLFAVVDYLELRRSECFGQTSCDLGGDWAATLVG